TGTTTVCVRLDTDEAKCWGDNTAGQLGLGDTQPRTTPAVLPALDLGAGRTTRGLALTSASACALRDDGTVQCWGLNTSGELGLGDTLTRVRPGGSVALLGPARSVVTGARHACATLADGRLQCWGKNLNGELGLGDSTNRTRPGPPADVGSGRTTTDVALGNYFTCALLDTLTVKCWGANYVGSLGLGDVLHRGNTPGTLGDSLPEVRLW
ncbi:MAG TPA: hypothetical protein VFH51_06435, partial [Myxococcota bacterium]|nr:hypothetical protein [Myxococcota bacterium]